MQRPSIYTGPSPAFPAWHLERHLSLQSPLSLSRPIVSPGGGSP